MEPAADVEVNPPGEIDMDVAPLVIQLRVLLAPEFTLAGFAVKDEIVGIEPVRETEFEVAQPVKTVVAKRKRTIAQSSSAEPLRPPGRILLLPKDLRNFMWPRFDAILKPV